MNEELNGKNDRHGMNSEKKMELDLWEIERELHAEGVGLICGVDEAGRGPLAGPVCAAAVILPPETELPGAFSGDSADCPRLERGLRIGGRDRGTEHSRRNDACHEPRDCRPQSDA